VHFYSAPPVHFHSGVDRRWKNDNPSLFRLVEWSSWSILWSTLFRGWTTPYPPRAGAYGPVWSSGPSNFSIGGVFIKKRENKTHPHRPVPWWGCFSSPSMEKWPLGGPAGPDILSAPNGWALELVQPLKNRWTTGPTSSDYEVKTFFFRPEYHSKPVQLRIIRIYKWKLA